MHAPERPPLSRLAPQLHATVCLVLALAACQPATVPPANAAPAVRQPTPPDASAASVAREWQGAFDLDGDGRNDRIVADYTGGAHCCYRISVALTSTGATVALPFELDGGYVGGLDLGQPERFDVRRTDATLPEIVMQIGAPGPVQASWKQKYGFSTHHIAVGFPGGELSVRDAPVL